MVRVQVHDRHGLPNADGVSSLFPVEQIARSPAIRPLVSPRLLALSCFAAEPLDAVELTQETSNAFSRYIVLTEERMARSLGHGDSFYSMDGKPELQREALCSRLRQG